MWCSLRLVKHLRPNSTIIFTHKVTQDTTRPTQPDTWLHTWATILATIQATRPAILFSGANTNSTRRQIQLLQKADWACSRLCTMMALDQACNSSLIMGSTIPWRRATTRVTMVKMRDCPITTINTSGLLIRASRPRSTSSTR